MDEQQQLAILARSPSISAAISPHGKDVTMVEKDMQSLSDAEAKLSLATEQLTNAAKGRGQPMTSSPFLSNQLKIATDRLALEERLSSSKFDEIESHADMALDRMAHPAKGSFAPALELVKEELCTPVCRVGNGVCARRSDSQGSEFSCVCRQPFTGPSCAERQGSVEPVTFYQTLTTHTGRLRNPALALLLEPLIYGYSLFSCAVFVMIAGVSSATCMHISRGPKEGDNAVDLTEAPAQLPRPQAAEGVVGHLKSYFRYPSAGLAPTPLAAAVESEDDAEVGVSSYSMRRRQEVWRPVQPGKESPMAVNEAWEGYVDDEPDDDVQTYSGPRSGRYQPVGYIDER
jgi:hypothetical protein